MDTISAKKWDFGVGVVGRFGGMVDASRGELDKLDVGRFGGRRRKPEEGREVGRAF